MSDEVSFVPKFEQKITNLLRNKQQFNREV